VHLTGRSPGWQSLVGLTVLWERQAKRLGSVLERFSEIPRRNPAR
jgi:hypothetical protein